MSNTYYNKKFEISFVKIQLLNCMNENFHFLHLFLLSSKLYYQRKSNIIKIVKNYIFIIQNQMTTISTNKYILKTEILYNN